MTKSPPHPSSPLGSVSSRTPLDDITNAVLGGALAPPPPQPQQPPIAGHHASLPSLLVPTETPSPPTSSLPQTPRRSSRIASVASATPSSSTATATVDRRHLATPVRLDGSPALVSGQRRGKEAGGQVDISLSGGARSVKKIRLASSSTAGGTGLSTRAAEKRRMVVDDESDDDDDEEDSMDVDGDLSARPSRPDFLRATAEDDERLPPTKGLRLPLPFNAGRGAGRTLGVLGYLDARASGGGSRPGKRRLQGAGGLASSLSTLDLYPSSLVSSHTEDVYRLPSTYAERDFTPLYSCAFSHGAKRVCAGGWNDAPQVVAVSSEEGVVDFIDAREGATADRERPRKRWMPHQNAVFDVSWSYDDALIATSSGDQTTAITDVETGQRVASLIGHRSSVKLSVFDPLSPTVVSTASRDGFIHVYDLRLSSTGSSADMTVRRRRTGGAADARVEDGDKHSPVNVIKHAHAEKGKKPNPSARTATRSPTSILYLPQRPHTLASAGTADGTIKLWDLRTHGSYSKKAALPPLAVEESLDPNWGRTSSVFGGSGGAGGSGTGGIGRSHGVASMVLGKEGDVIYALGTDNRIHTHSPLNLAHALPFTYSAPTLQSTFYSRLALSPCGSYIASGSGRGDVHVWEVRGGLADSPTGGREREGVRLEFQGKAVRGGAGVLGAKKMEVGSVSWGACGLASCSDDLSLRIWKPNVDAAQYLRDDPAGARWSWAGRAYG